ncbi:unnamed protein product [Coffea canephora]|uniref:Uncharacterized protein n=1 Tax=Coffea canephora TaxID=49390 RepID=A0A068V8Q4_COFCA|nr:unnamed protein product [Coffea canephora]
MRTALCGRKTVEERNKKLQLLVPSNRRRIEAPLERNFSQDILAATTLYPCIGSKFRIFDLFMGLSSLFIKHDGFTW